MALVGLEPTSKRPRITTNLVEGGAKSTQTRVDTTPCDPKRRKVIEMIPELPEPVIDAILALIAATSPPKQ